MDVFVSFVFSSLALVAVAETRSAGTPISRHFEKVVGYHLADSSAVVETTFGRKPLECMSKCIAHQDCVMVDVKKVATKNYRCELLSPVSAYNLNWADCEDYYSAGVSQDGIYPVFPNGSSTYLRVYCELYRDDGWTRIQRREDGSVDFFRSWDDYKKGFGKPSGEHWLGNDVIHLLTNQKTYQLKVDLLYNNRSYYYAEYSTFSVDDELHDYVLHVSGYSGTAGDGLADNADPRVIHDGMAFSTFDRDNDLWPAGNAAAELHSAYWYNALYFSHLNGEYWQDVMGNVCGSNSTWGSPACIQWEPISLSQGILEVTMKVKPR